MLFILFCALTVQFIMQSMAHHKPPGFHPKYLQLCSEDEQSFYGFGNDISEVINNNISISGWSIPFTYFFILNII